MTALLGEAALFSSSYKCNSPVAPSDFDHLVSGYGIPLGSTTREYLAGLFTGHGTARGSGDIQKTRESSRLGSGGVRNVTDRAGSGQNILKYHGSGRVTLTRSDWYTILYHTEKSSDP